MTIMRHLSGDRGLANRCLSGVVKFSRRRGIAGNVSKIMNSPRTVRVHVRLDNPADLRTLSTSQEEIALLAGVQGLNVTRELNEVVFEFSKPHQMWGSSVLEALPKGVIGLDAQGRPFKFDYESPNTLIVGSPGSGKTVLATTIITSILRRGDEKLYVVDPHNQINKALSGVGDGIHFFVTPDEISDCFKAMVAILEERKEKGGVRFEPVRLIIDEASSESALGSAIKINKDNFDLVAKIIREGRKFNVRVVLITQKPTEKDLPGVLSLIDYRFIGRLTSRRVASALAGEAGIPTLTGKGDFLCSGPAGLVRFTCAWPENVINSMRGSANV